MPGRLTLQRVEHDTRLDTRDLARRIDTAHAVDILRQVHDDRDVAALTGEARTAPARQDRGTVLPAHVDGRDHIVQIAGNDDADGHLPIVGSVGRIQRTAAAIESHFAAHDLMEIPRQIGVKGSLRRGKTIGGQCRGRHWRALHIIATPPTARPSAIVRCSLAHVCGLDFVLRAANRPCAP